jgi:hypothetical protein
MIPESESLILNIDAPIGSGSQGVNSPPSGRTRFLLTIPRQTFDLRGKPGDGGQGNSFRQRKVSSHGERDASPGALEETGCELHSRFHVNSQHSQGRLMG